MSGHPSNTQQIGDALAAFRATRSAYLSSSDQATSDLLVALSEAVMALDSGNLSGAPAAAQLAVLVERFRASRPLYQSSSDQALSDLLTLLGDQVVALRAHPGGQVAQASQSAISELQGQIDMLQLTVRSQESEIQRLREQRGTRRSASAAPSIESPPKVMRPPEYWAENIPDYGDNLTPEQARQHLHNRRVRPEDVVLTPEDIARNTRRKPQQDMSAANQQMVSLLIGVLMILALLSWVAMSITR
ncbi:MAG TPA: hypothetical protein VFS21_37440 [Roseiflexaceae bacterium]|nr:hypothetical protein [Roseiflexaceae bacterium]